MHGLWFYCLVLEIKHSRKKTAAIAAATVLLSQLAMMFLAAWVRGQGGIGSDMSVMLLYLSGYLVTMVIFGGSYVFFMSGSEPAKSLFMVSTYYSFWTLIYLTISMATYTFAGAGDWAVWSMRLVLNLGSLFLYQRLLKQRLMRMYKEIRIGYGTAAAVSSFAFLVMTIVIFYNQSVKRQDLLHMAMFFLSSSMMLIIHVQLFYYIVQQDYGSRLKQMELHEKYLRVQINSYEQMEQSARQTRHDFRHHNMVVAEYARKKDYQAILTYLQEYEVREEDKYSGDFCRNHVVNNLLCAYVNRARQEGVEVSVDVRLGETTGISDYDLVTIFANVLENAVNACGREAGKRRIEVALRQKSDKLVFVCKNTCTAEVAFKNGIPRNQERVGVGVGSVLSSVEKYDGAVDFSVADNMFICQIILNNMMTPKIRGGVERNVRRFCDDSDDSDDSQYRRRDSALFPDQ